MGRYLDKRFRVHCTVRHGHFRMRSTRTERHRERVVSMVPMSRKCGHRDVLAQGPTKHHRIWVKPAERAHLSPMVHRQRRVGEESEPVQAAAKQRNKRIHAPIASGLTGCSRPKARMHGAEPWLSKSRRSSWSGEKVTRRNKMSESPLNLNGISVSCVRPSQGADSCPSFVGKGQYQHHRWTDVYRHRSTWPVNVSPQVTTLSTYGIPAYLQPQTGLLQDRPGFCQLASATEEREQSLPGCAVLFS